MKVCVRIDVIYLGLYINQTLDYSTFKERKSVVYKITFYLKRIKKLVMTKALT